MTRRRHWILKLLALLAVLGFIAGACASDDDDGDNESATTTAEESEADSRGADGVLTVGTLLPFTGQLASFGPGMRGATEIAVNEINAAGGVLGKDVVLDASRDDGTDADKASAEADSIVSSSQADFVVGAAASTVTTAVIDKLTASGISQCSPSSTAPNVVTQNDNGNYFFRTAPNDKLQGQAIGNVITGDGHTKVAIVAQNDDYGKGLAASAKTALEDSGAEVADEVYFDPNASDMTADVDKVVASEPEAVFIVAFADKGGPALLSAMIEKGVGPADLPLYTADGLKSSSLPTNVNASDPSVLDGMKGSVPKDPPEGTFTSTFKQQFPNAQTTFTAQSYDCMMIAALAAEAAKSDDPQKFKEEVANVTKDGTECTSFAQCKQLLDQGTDIAYVGPSGALQLIDEGEPGVAQYTLWQFQGGQDVAIPGEPIQLEDEEAN